MSKEIEHVQFVSTCRKDEKIVRHVAKNGNMLNGNIRHVEATFDMLLRHVEFDMSNSTYFFDMLLVWTGLYRHFSNRHFVPSAELSWVRYVLTPIIYYIHLCHPANFVNAPTLICMLSLVSGTRYTNICTLSLYILDLTFSSFPQLNFK